MKVTSPSIESTRKTRRGNTKKTKKRRKTKKGRETSQTKILSLQSKMRVNHPSYLKNKSTMITNLKTSKNKSTLVVNPISIAREIRRDQINNLQDNLTPKL